MNLILHFELPGAVMFAWLHLNEDTGIKMYQNVLKKKRSKGRRIL